MKHFYLCILATILLSCHSQTETINNTESVPPADNQIILPPVPTPSETRPEIKFTDISSGEWTTCALSTAGKIYCWGSNSMDSLGREGFQQNGSAHPEIITYLKDNNTTASSLSVGEYGHNCFVDRSLKKPYCWGNLAKGSTNTGILYHSVEPQEILLPDQTPLTNIVAISSGDDVCAISTDAKLYCWQKGQFFNGELKYPAKLVTAENIPLSHIVHVSSAGSIKCAVSSEGDAYCWGSTYYPLGTGQKKFVSYESP